MKLIKNPTEDDLEYLLPLIKASGYDECSKRLGNKIKAESLSEAAARIVKEQNPNKGMYIIRDDKGNTGFALFDVLDKKSIYLNFVYGPCGTGKQLGEALKEEWDNIYADVLNGDGREKARKVLAQRYGADVGIFRCPLGDIRFKLCNLVFRKEFY